MLNKNAATIMTLDELRAFFPHTERMIYLNHAATSPLSKPVIAAIAAYLEQRHVSPIENYFDFQPVMDETKVRLGWLLQTRSQRIAFTPNTSSGLGILAQGLDWQPGDRIALPGCEFPANVYPFMSLARRGVEVDFIPHRDGVVTLDDVAAVLTPRTRLLTVSWVQFLSGFRSDLAALGRLCHDQGVLFCVDAIQGLGAFPLDVEACGVDFLACGGHKWLMGVQGLGFLYITEALQDRVAPPVGWLQGPIDWDNFFAYALTFHPDAGRYHTGTFNSMGIAALHAALGLYAEAGAAWCADQVLDRARRLADGLETMGLARYGTADPAHASGIVTVHHPDAQGLCDFLATRNIIAAVRNRMIRFAPTYYNAPDEIERTLETVRDFGKVQVSR